jgi:DNA repair photolyase
MLNDQNPQSHTSTPLPILKGRGTPLNPTNRFQTLDIIPDPDDSPNDREQRTTDNGPKTTYLIDNTRSIIAYNDSPDVSFDASVNPYHGCEYGCVYCFARPTHEYLDLSIGLDFETKILVKADAPTLLRKELSAKSWKPQTLALSGVTDPYQPIERKLQLTRRCLEILLEFRNPVAMITKSHTITRDAELLAQLARLDAAMACISITTLDNDLARIMEPRASRPGDRLAAVKALADARVPVGVLVAPIVPAINDHEIAQILQAAADHGATFAGYVPLRLPWGIKDLFTDWLTRNFPDRKDKVINRVKDIRGGKLYRSDYFKRGQGEGPFAQYIANLFDVAARRANVNQIRIKLDASHFRRHGAESLFD